LNRFAFLLFAIIIVSFFVSCSPARRVQEGQYLLNRNRIVIEDADISRSELKTYFRQRPNRRILFFFRFHLHVYNIADEAPSNRITRWMKNTIGEPPVIYDPSLTQNTLKQFELYMQSKGFFNAKIAADHNLESNRKATITYHITGGRPYTFRNVSYNLPDPTLKEFVLKDTINSLIKPQARYDADVLQNERNRVTRMLRNNGYFRFSRDFIFFSVDSMLGNHQVDIEMRISNPLPLTTRDTVIQMRHKRFQIGDVVILPEYSALASHLPRTDTTIYNGRYRRNQKSYPFTFIHNGDLRIKPNVVASHIMMRNGEYFRISDVENTYSFLSDMRNFRYINLSFNEDLSLVTDTTGIVHTTVQLNRSPSNAFSIEAEGLNTAGNLGIASNFVYRNRNIFNGAEIFNLRFKSALEVTGERLINEVISNLPFNTLELGMDVGIEFPKLLLPLPIERLSRNSRPQSSVAAGINFRQRPDYTRYILNLNYGFEWNETSAKRHFIYPMEISSVRVFNDSILRANIPQANPFILSRFRDHFILGSKYTYVLNTQKIGKLQDFKYLRVNAESAGNMLNLAADGLNLQRDENNSYNVFNIPFSQFVKADADYRYYRLFDERQTLVFRMMGGLGVPYGNVKVLPFIKSYYGGGANGLRAWKIYTLGPGSYSGTDEVRFDRYGDIKLEMNMEYRFKFHGLWHGAFFVDAGNVWFVRKNDQFPGGEFKFNKIAHDLAMGGGLGVRMDFSYFIFRLDAAVPIKNPARPLNEQWISSWPQFKDYNFNIGIGYPF
jgi:outer membrane protein assembly factor BamA